MRLKVSSAKWRPFCLGLNVLTKQLSIIFHAALHDTVHIETHCDLGGGTKAPFVKFSVSKIFDLAKVPVGFFESLSYLTGITAAPAKYKRDIQYLTCVLTTLKNSENNGTGEIGLVTPTPVDMGTWNWVKLPQIMACCLTAPSHYLNQCRPIISEVLWHSCGGYFTGNEHDIHP